MPLLFSYGSLQDEKVQLATFGRRLQGEPDTLAGYETSLVAIDDPQVAAALGAVHYLDARPSVRAESVVRGIAFAVTEAEIAAADAYEAPAGYGRIRVALASGKSAWVYVHRAADAKPADVPLA